MRKCNGHGPGGTVRCLDCVDGDDSGRVVVINPDAASTEYTDPLVCVVRVSRDDRTQADYHPRGG